MQARARRLGHPRAHPKTRARPDVPLDSRCSSSIEVDWVADGLFDTKLLLPLSPRSGSASVAAMKSRGECVGRAITDEAGDFREALFATAQMVTRECHPPVREVLHRGLSERLAERACEGRAGHAAEFGQFGNRPWVCRVTVHRLQRCLQPRIG